MPEEEIPSVVEGVDIDKSWPAKVGHTLRKPALLRRFPVLWRYRPAREELHPKGLEQSYPRLADRITFARKVIDDPFAEANRRALAAQNRHRRQRVAMILGSLLATGFAAAQASFTSAAWIGVVVATLAAATATMTALIQQDEALHRYISERRKAERLRSLSFTFVSEPGPEGSSQIDRFHKLRSRVAVICHQSE
jgi:hypothetical protein